MIYFLQDLRFAFRGRPRRPEFTAIALRARLLAGSGEAA